MGKPQGIAALSTEQRRHRNNSLAFFSRGRFGPVTEIRVVNSRNQYPRELSFAPSFSLSELNPLPTGMRELAGTVRLSFEYRDDDLVEQSAYDRNDRPLYRLRYTGRDVAEYRWGAFSREMRESGITHIEFVRPQAGPQAGRNTEVRFMDGLGKARPDRDGSYGFRQTFAEHGLALKAVMLGADLQPAANRAGVASIETTFDQQGNLTSIRNLGADGRRRRGRCAHQS